MTNHELWQTVLAEFELKLPGSTFRTWFHDTGLVSFEGGRLVVCVPHNIGRQWIKDKYHNEIIKIVERITGKPVKNTEYAIENIKNISEIEVCRENQEATKPVGPKIEPKKNPQVPESTERAEETEKNRPTHVIMPTKPKDSTGFFSQSQSFAQNSQKNALNAFGLNSKYTFNSFIVGKGNELAHAAAQAVAARPGEAYNPLFIYGGVGLGKTHLIQAVGNTLLEKNPQTRIVYVNSEKFTNDFVASIKEGRSKEFKERYRTADLLLIDDIQFIAGKEQTQEEFFHTFNELHQQGRQVILTSDRPPKAIPALEDRLRSRFEWGMIVDISAPDLETRVAILNAKCQEKNLSLPMESVEKIARTIQSNIRELEGVLNKIIAWHQLRNQKPTIQSVDEVMATMENAGERKTLASNDIIREVARYFSLQVEDLLGKSREKKLSHPRQIIMYLLRKELRLSYPSIGAELGGRDHTTAMHAQHKIEVDIEKDEKLKQDVAEIRARLQKIFA